MDPIIPDLQAWLTGREQGIRQLRLLVDELNSLQKGANITSVIGSVTSIGGVLVGLGALALTPVTGGASLVPGVVAVNAGVVGKGAAVVGNMVKNSKTKQKMNEVEKIFEEDKICTEKIQTLIKKFEEVEQNILSLIEDHVKVKLASEGGCGEVVGSIGSEDSTTDVEEMKVVQTTCPENSQSVAVANASRPLPTIAGKVKAGVAMIRRLNIANINKVLRLSRAIGTPIAGSIPKLGAGSGGAANTAITAGANVLELGKMARYGGVVVSVALLPIDVYNLVKKALELKRGDMHKESQMIEAQIKTLEDEMKTVQEYLFSKLQEMNNFVLLMDSILSSGCQEELGLLITRILKCFLPLEKLVKAFDRIDFQMYPPFMDNTKTSKLSAVLINCAETNDSIYKRISILAWCAWVMGNNTAVFLQNTSFHDDPVLWALFDVSINSFNPDLGHGVSLLLPNNFQGDIESTQEYKCNGNSWNGRCLIVNILYQDENYSLVSLLAPDSKLSRDLFMIEMSRFIKHNATGKIILGSNFRSNLQTMTTVIKRRVSKKVPLSFIKSLVPFKEVSEYLLNKPKETDGPMLLTYQMAKKYSLMKPEEIDIRWCHCCGTQISVENHVEQIKPILKLGLIDLLEKKNPGAAEFSTEFEASERVVNCSQNLDFFVSPNLEKDIEVCHLDHTLRLLGFLKQSPLLVKGS